MVGALIVALMLGACSCTPTDTLGNIQSLQGILKKVDSISGEVIVTLNDGSTITFNLNDVTAETLSEALGNASLEIGTLVIIDRDRDGKVIGLKSHTAETEGVIKSLDPAKQKVTITINKKNQLTVNMTIATVIMSEDNTRASFTQLRTGQTIEVWYDVESKNALRLNIVQEYDILKSEIMGQIVGIDKEAFTITVQDKTGMETPPLKVTSATKLWFDKAGTFDRLYVGMEVKIKLNPETNELLRLEGKDLRSPIEKFLETSE